MTLIEYLIHSEKLFLYGYLNQQNITYRCNCIEAGRDRTHDLTESRASQYVIHADKDMFYVTHFVSSIPLCQHHTCNKYTNL